MREGEVHLWQSVLHAALMDATSDKPIHERKDDIEWVTGNGRDFRAVCTLAGKDPDGVHDQFIRGKICSDMLRMGGSRIVQNTSPAMRALSDRVVAWLRDNGPSTVHDIRKGLKRQGNSNDTRAALMMAMQSDRLRISGHRDYVTLYEVP